ncbi:hypothetical protein KRMM14A1259_51050 [Krasilnikovia sp. MM14-A1259]
MMRHGPQPAHGSHDRRELSFRQLASERIPRYSRHRDGWGTVIEPRFDRPWRQVANMLVDGLQHRPLALMLTTVPRGIPLRDKRPVEGQIEFPPLSWSFLIMV